MSSLRNSVQRRSHRERGQLKGRERLGLLEKHKDYALRAKDHKKKQTVLKSLKQKAADRNEDEFYFGMVSRGKFSTGPFGEQGKRWTGTVAGDRGNKAMDVDTVRLLKTQDIGYIRTMRNVAAKEVAELEQKATIAASLAGVDVNDDDEDDEYDFDSDEDEAPRKPKPNPKPKKIVFAESAEELQEIIPRQQDDDDINVDDDEDDENKEVSTDAAKRAENAERLRRKLQNAKKKLRALANAENELEIQRARMAKTATVGGVTKSGKQIKIRERKR